MENLSNRSSDASGMPLVSDARYTPRSTFEKICRAAGLSGPYFAWRQRGKRPGKAFEGRKIALYGDRTSAALSALIHVLPVGASLAIVSLNLRKHYIGGELAGLSGQDNEKFAGLQLAAKLHELLINASLASILWSYIRYQIALGSGLPFGAVFAGLQFKDLSFLWSSEFWGAARARFSHPKQRWILLTLITIFTLLGLSVGPSSANILKPRLDWWEAGGTTFWMNATFDDLFPRHYTGSQVSPSCAIDTGDASCPSGNWEIIGQNYLSHWTHFRADSLEDAIPEVMYVSGVRSVRALQVKGRSPFELYPHDFAWASVPYSALGDGIAEIGRFWSNAALRTTKNGWRFNSRIDAVYQVSATQPVVHVRCRQSDWPNPESGSNTTDYSLGFYNLADTEMYMNPYGHEFPVVDYHNDSLTPVILEAFNTSSPSLFWIDLPGDKFGNASIGVAVVVPSQNNATAALNLCAVDARIGPDDIQSSRGHLRYVTDVLNNDEPVKITKSWSTLPIDAAWASYLFPNDPTLNRSVFDRLLVAAGIWNFTSVSPFGVKNVPYILETLFAASIANGLSRVNYNTTLAGQLKEPYDEWQRQMMPVGSYIGPGGDAFELRDQSPDSVTKFTAQVTVNGYAYSMDGFTTWGSVLILLIYCTLAISHIVYLLWSGISSGSWDTISEITTLAMNSKRTDVLHNTGAGIDTIAVFQENVQVMARGEHLEFVFQDPSPGMDRVEKDVPYS